MPNDDFDDTEKPHQQKRPSKATPSLASTKSIWYYNHPTTSNAPSSPFSSVTADDANPGLLVGALFTNTARK